MSIGLFNSLDAVNLGVMPPSPTLTNMLRPEVGFMTVIYAPTIAALVALIMPAVAAFAAADFIGQSGNRPKDDVVDDALRASS